VNLWVDYSNKYGLGYLLSDGSCGVHFNDYTKIILHPNGRDVQYVTKKAVQSPATGAGSGSPQQQHGAGSGSGGGGFDVQNFQLDSYPPAMHKKVLLLHHFMKYLIQQNKNAAPQPGAPDHLDYCAPFDPARPLPHVRSWCRTEHAMIFRLSSRTSQFIFFDETELVLSTDTCVVAYTDKQKERNCYSFSDVFSVPRPDLHRRMKYARQVMSAPPSSSSAAAAAGAPVPVAAPAPGDAAPAADAAPTAAAAPERRVTRSRARE
jgi:polo-like kinase 1